MPTILQGNLRAFPAGELLTLLGAPRHSGSLRVSSAGKSCRIIFHHGKVVWADADDARFELCAMLAAYGLAKPKEIEAIRQSGLSAALHEGLVTQPQLTFRISQIVFDLFIWDEGRFTFDDDVAVPEEIATVALDYQALIEEGVRRSEEARKLLQLYPDENVILRVVDNPGQEAQISLSAEEFRILFRIGTGRVLRELRTDLGKAPQDLYPILHELERSGLVTLAEAPRADETIVEKRNVVSTVGPTSLSTPHPDLPSPVIPAAFSNDEPTREEEIDATIINSVSASDVHARNTEPQAGSVPSSGSDPSVAETKPHELATAPEPPPIDLAQPPSEEARKRPSIGSLTREGAEAATYPLMDDEMTIGRDASNSIAIGDGSISSRHARLVRAQAGFVIEDLQSRNGTFVNGERVTEKRMLADNDLVRLGKVLLTFNLATEVRSIEQTRPEMLQGH